MTITRSNSQPDIQAIRNKLNRMRKNQGGFLTDANHAFLLQRLEINPIPYPEYLIDINVKIDIIYNLIDAIQECQHGFVLFTNQYAESIKAQPKSKWLFGRHGLIGLLRAKDTTSLFNDCVNNLLTRHLNDQLAKYVKVNAFTDVTNDRFSEDNLLLSYEIIMNKYLLLVKAHIADLGGGCSKDSYKSYLIAYLDRLENNTDLYKPEDYFTNNDTVTKRMFLFQKPGPYEIEHLTPLFKRFIQIKNHMTSVYNKLKPKSNSKLFFWNNKKNAVNSNQTNANPSNFNKNRR